MLLLSAFFFSFFQNLPIASFAPEEQDDRELSNARLRVLIVRLEVKGGPFEASFGVAAV